MVFRDRRTRILLIILAFTFMPLAAAAEDKQPAPPVNSSAEEARPPEDISRQSAEDAITLARQKVEMDPSSVKELVALGNLLLDKGVFAEAESVFDEALLINDRYHDALTGKGIALARMGKEQMAEEFLLKALVLNPNPVRTHYELGLRYEKRGDVNKAVSEYKQGIEKYKQGRK